jgi:hypothetical protein
VLSLLTNQLEQNREPLEDLWSGRSGCHLDNNSQGKFISIFVPEGFTVITTIIPIIGVEDPLKLDITANFTAALNSSDTLERIDALKPARGIVYGIISVAIFWSVFVVLMVF